MSHVHYCLQWFRADKVPVDLLSEDEAFAAYNTRTLYTALLGDKDHPQCFVECNMQYIGVEFLDDHLRSHVDYQFSENQPGRLFLSMAVRRQYIGDSDKVKRGVAFMFHEDGSVIVDREDFVAHICERADIHLDVSKNWERYPAFGDYSALIRREREEAWGEIWATCLETMDDTPPPEEETEPGFVPFFPELAVIEEPLSKLTVRHGVALTAAIAERFWARYRASSRTPEWNAAEAVQEGLEKIWAWLVEATMGKEEARDLHALYTELFFDVEEKYSPGDAYYAQGACAGIAGAAQAILIGEGIYATQGVHDARRALDQVLQGLIVAEKGVAALAKVDIDSHPLMLEEIAREEEDLRVLQDHELTPRFLSEFRKKCAASATIDKRSEGG